MSEPKEEKDVPIQYRGTREYRRRLAQCAIDNGVKVKGLLDHAVRPYLSGQLKIGHDESKDGRFDMIQPAMADVIAKLGTAEAEARNIAETIDNVKASLRHMVGGEGAISAKAVGGGKGAHPRPLKRSAL